MIVGIGVDLVEIPRFRKLLEAKSRRLIDRGAHSADVRHAPAAAGALGRGRSAEYWAARFAVKEAFAKAIGTGLGGSFAPKEVGVAKDAGGRPYLVFAPPLARRLRKMGVRASQVSIAHAGRYAAAFVVLEGEPG